ncbi:VOC family protein [Kaistia defluvii]|uniref:VOC family protein n=1 Tax=Kaistia defluvii TaxID=410841 RepID=UPI00225608E3|nr:VOC family protein [Kaistia defluvii]MCX5519778.1 VOC family protein [Kaistia defluvii]
MSIQTVAHINFRGEARPALSFYQSVFGGDLVLLTHAQIYGTTDPAEADRVGWGRVVSKDGFVIMAYDVPTSRAYDPGQSPFFISISGNASDEIITYWDRLKLDGEILQDLAPAGWSPLYGMLKDRFGITWVLDVQNGDAR